MSYHVRSAGSSHVGYVRARNEDRWACLDIERCFLLADGMGGHVAGDIAAEMTVDLLAEFLRKQWLPAVQSGYDPRELLCKAICATHQKLLDREASEPSLAGMGATLCTLCLLESEAIVAHVGDSRIYRLRSGRLRALTRDHSLATALHREGREDEAKMAKELYSNVVLQAMGASEKVRPTVRRRSLRPGDLFLICSDGLTDMVQERQIASVLREPLSLQERADGLIQAACSAGGRDNITVILIEVHDNGNE